MDKVPPKTNRIQASVTSILVLLFSAVAIAAAPTWRAGTASANITPSESMWLAGYASRTNAANGKAMDLWMKVLALDDAQGHRGIFLTSDTLGIPQSIYQHTCVALKKKFDLEPGQIVLSASHTHCGPVLRNALYDAYPLDEHQIELINQYSAELEEKIVDTAGKALADLAPAHLAAGQGIAGFAVNRRNNPEAKVPKLIEEGALKGPTDHSVPVLAVYLPDGKLKAVLFGYACHNTTLGFDKWCGDYAGYAQLALEKSHPGATAMFFMGCGGDQNPLPRKRMELAERYGQMLASAVEEALIAPPQQSIDGKSKGLLSPTLSSKGGEGEDTVAPARKLGAAAAPSPIGQRLIPLAPTLQTSLEMVALNFGPAPTEAELEQMISPTNNPSHRRYANRLLAELKAGKKFPRSYPYPVQAWRLGDSQLLIALGGEPVVDYSLKFKQQFGPQTWVAGYCNDVMTYIPSLRVLKEGGYEGGGAMVPYGQPALRWGDDVEELITEAVGLVAAEVSK